VTCGEKADLPELREVGDDRAALRLRGAARVHVDHVVARFEEVFDDPVAGFAAAAGDNDAFHGHGERVGRNLIIVRRTATRLSGRTALTVPAASYPA
jgi:hypothetical protein